MTPLRICGSTKDNWSMHPTYWTSISRKLLCESVYVAVNSQTMMLAPPVLVLQCQSTGTCMSGIQRSLFTIAVVYLSFTAIVYFFCCFLLLCLPPMSVQGRGRCKVQTLHGTALQQYSVASALTRSWEHYI